MSNRRKIKPLRSENRQRLPVADFVWNPRPPGPVTIADRQGVWQHSFKCRSCDLEFVVFSWLPDRHRVGEVYCPECGTQTPMLHLRAILSESAAFDPLGSNEIFRRWRLTGSEVMDDTPGGGFVIEDIQPDSSDG
jgi:hypothetical protein